MRKTLVTAPLALAALAALVAGTDAPKAPKTLTYLKADTIDVVALLPPPPAANSPETKAELDEIYALQQSRTEADVNRAKREEALTPFEFADVVGEWFDGAKLPETKALFERLTADSKAASSAAKKVWNRRRPPYVDDRLHAAVTLEDEGAYPSGHATRGTLFALVLAELMPDRADALIARGQLVGFDRVLGGVHYPSDVAAGRVLGQAQFHALMNVPTFAADLARAKAEIDAARPRAAAAAR